MVCSFVRVHEVLRFQKKTQNDLLYNCLQQITNRPRAVAHLSRSGPRATSDNVYNYANQR